MMPRRFLLAMIMLLLQATGFADGVVVEAPSRAMVASYWGYVVFLPVMIVAFVVDCCLSGPKR
jgi:uncharacterized membrane protein